MATSAIAGVAAVACGLCCLNATLKDHECPMEAKEHEQHDYDHMETFVNEELERIHREDLFHAHIFKGVDEKRLKIFFGFMK